MTDAERRAGHRVADAERARGAAHERRLARAELAAHEHHVAVRERRGQLGAERFRLGGIRWFRRCARPRRDSRACPPVSSAAARWQKQTGPRENGTRAGRYSWRDGDRTFIGSRAMLDFRTCDTLFDTPRRNPSFAGKMPGGRQASRTVRADPVPSRPSGPCRLAAAARRLAGFAGCGGSASSASAAACSSSGTSGAGGCSGAPEREQLRQPREVLAQRLEHARRVQRGRGMEDRVQPHGARAEHEHLGLTVQARDPGRVAAQQLRREVAERADHRRLDQLDLTQQVLLAVLDLDRQRVAVAGGPAVVHHAPAVTKLCVPSTSMQKKVTSSRLRSVMSSTSTSS